MRGLASFARSTAPSNSMDAQRSTGVLLSRPAAAQRCAEGAGLDSGAAVKAQSAMPSIALPCSVSTAHSYPPTPAASTAPQLQPRISTSLTDVTSVPAARWAPRARRDAQRGPNGARSHPTSSAPRRDGAGRPRRAPGGRLARAGCRPAKVHRSPHDIAAPDARRPHCLVWSGDPRRA